MHLNHFKRYAFREVYQSAITVSVLCNSPLENSAVYDNKCSLFLFTCHRLTGVARLQVSGWPGLLQALGWNQSVLWISSCSECFLLMVDQRSGRGQTTPAHPSTFISAQTPPADIPLAKPSHMAKPKVRDGAVPSACRKAVQA